MTTKAKCLHCKTYSGCRPRGLCSPCYKDKSIRWQYVRHDRGGNDVPDDEPEPYEKIVGCRICGCQGKLKSGLCVVCVPKWRDMQRALKRVLLVRDGEPEPLTIRQYHTSDLRRGRS